MSDEGAAPGEKETARLEAFSDGVFAVAITLLGLDLVKTPQPAPGEALSSGALVAAVGAQWPSYLAFVVSFATILIMWVNHHSMFRLIQKSDPALMFANGALLLLITLVPAPTALLSEFLTEPAGRAAAAFYGGLFVLISAAFLLVWWVAAFRRALLRPGTPLEPVRRRLRANLISGALYALAFLGAFISPFLTVGICVALGLFWALDGLLIAGPTDGPRRRRDRPPVDRSP